MHFNWIVILGSAIIPLIVGGLWYSPFLFANAWMKAADMTEEKIKGSNMAMIFGLTLVLGVLMSFILMPNVIHQMHYYSILADNPEMKDPNSALSQAAKTFMDNYGTNFRTFKHGAFHGALLGIFMGLPIIGIISLFERRTRSYVFIHAGYFILTLALMGGVICAFA